MTEAPHSYPGSEEATSPGCLSAEDRESLDQVYIAHLKKEIDRLRAAAEGVPDYFEIAGKMGSALVEILKRCDEPPTDNNAWVVAIQAIASAALSPTTAQRSVGRYELAEFLCETLALESFDSISREKYLRDAKAILEFLADGSAVAQAPFPFLCPCCGARGTTDGKASTVVSTPAQAAPERGALTKLAAECHRAKWEFDLSEEFQPSKSAARVLIKNAFNALHRIGDMALKFRDGSVVSSTTRAALPGHDETMANLDALTISPKPRCTCAAIVNPNIPHARFCPLSSTDRGGK